MSTGSWDDSSTLVKELPSPTNTDKDKDKDEVFEKVAQSPLYVVHAASDPKSRYVGIGNSPIKTKKSKAAKGLGFLLKAREGAKKRSKSPLKSPKSPSKETLTKELTEEELAENEKLKSKSEHWQAFMSMQDRIKSNVLKTQSSLLQTGRISPSGRISPAKSDKEDHRDGSSPWTQFDNTTDSDYQSDTQQFFDNSQQDGVNEYSYNDQVVPEGNEDYLSSVPSIYVGDQSKQYDRAYSLEQENVTDILEFENTLEKSEHEINEDPFGFNLDKMSSDIPPQPSNVASEDLLGLEDFLGPCNVQPATQDSSTDWFSGYSSSVQSSAQSSLCSSPTGFDQEFLADPGSTAVSDLAKSLVDDFLQWGAETAEKDINVGPISTNPFHTPSLPPKGVRVPPTTPDMFDPLKSGSSLDGLWGSPSTNQTPFNLFQQPTDCTTITDQVDSSQTSAFSQPSSKNPFMDDSMPTRRDSSASDSSAVNPELFSGMPVPSTPPIRSDILSKLSASPAKSPIKIARQLSKQKKSDPFSALFKAAKDPSRKFEADDDEEDEPQTLAGMKAKAERLKSESDTQSDIMSNNISSIDIESVSEIKSSTNSDPFGAGTGTNISDQDPFGSAFTSDKIDSFGSSSPFGVSISNDPVVELDPFGSSKPLEQQHASSDPFGFGKSTENISESDPFGAHTADKSDPYGMPHSEDSDPFGAPPIKTVISEQSALDMDIFGTSKSADIKPNVDPFESNDQKEEFAKPNPFQDVSDSDPFSQSPAMDTKESNQQPAEKSDPFDAWDSKPSSNTGVDPFSATNAEKRFSQMDFEDDDFFTSKISSSAPSSDAWGAIDSKASTQTANPFEDDLFTTENIPMQVDETAAPESHIQPINPFLTASFENIAAENKNTQPSLFLGESTFGVDTHNSQPFSSPSKQRKLQEDDGDPFDPFTEAPNKRQENQGMDLLSTEEKRMSTSDYDNLEEDEKETFKLEIKTSAKTLLESGPPPMLPPPPKPPKSPQIQTRENPFDRDSPPEENFAKFEVVEEELKTKQAPEPRERIMSTSTEDSTPDDEDDHLPLDDFHPPFKGEGWKLMLRQPTKKKLAGNRFWKTVFVKIAKVKEGIAIQLFYEENQTEPFQELPLQPCYALSNLSVQQYDQFGKIHTVKIQYVFYRERVGIKPERITPSFVRKPKPTMILDHAPQMSELLKFGSLDEELLQSFVWEVEDAFMKLESFRDKTLSYNKDEVTAEVWEEYEAEIDKLGHVKTHKGRVRLFFMAFVTGMPWCELGLNDKRRKGREVVGRHDIIPVKTEDWINIETPEFHCSVDLDEYEKTHTIKFHPLDACQFELCRFRVRPKYNRELPLQVRCQQTLKDRHFEIRCDMLVTGYHANTKKHGQFPCEDIEVRFKIPEQWIYLFRYEKRFGYGSFKASARKPGKIKGLERITMIAQGTMTPTLMEASSGTAKYENLYHSVIWRISRLPERNQGAYKSHLFVLRLDLGPHDDIPEKFDDFCQVKFTMPSSTVSKTQVRSISVDNPNPPEKWVRYLAKYQYKVEIDTQIESGSEQGTSDE